MSVLLTSAIEWVAATSLGRVAHAKAGIGVNFIVSNVQRISLEFLRESFKEVPPSQGVSTTSVSHSSLAWQVITIMTMMMVMVMMMREEG